MPKAATRAKARWNASNYAQIKVSVYPEIADAFKTACAAAGVSMASELARFMTEYSEVPIAKKTAAANKALSKKKRRNTVRALILQLEQVREAEEESMDNTPENFRKSDNFAASEESLAKLEEAIEILENIY